MKFRWQFHTPQSAETVRQRLQVEWGIGSPWRGAILGGIVGGIAGGVMWWFTHLMLKPQKF